MFQMSSPLFANLHQGHHVFWDVLRPFWIVRDGGPWETRSLDLVGNSELVWTLGIGKDSIWNMDWMKRLLTMDSTILV